MKDLITKEEAKQLFEKKIKPLLGPIERERQRVVDRLASERNKIIFLAAAVNLLVLWSARSEDYFHSLSIVLISAFTYYFFRYQKIIKPFRQKFKDKVLVQIFQGMIGPCQFSMEGFISRTDFDESRIINNSYNSYGGEDLLEGKFQNMNFKFSELSVSEIRKKGKRTETKVRFNGLFFAFKLPFNTYHNTLILQDKEEKYIGKLIGRALQKFSERQGYQLVQLESLAFEKEYAVYTNDQIKCRVLLKPTVMESLVSFKKRHKDSINISLRGENLYLAINSFKNHFEPNIHKECINMNEIREIYDIFLLVRDLLEDFEITAKAA